MRKEELDLLIEYVKEAALSGIAVDLSAKVGALSADMTCRMLFGKKYMEEEFDERGFKAVMDETMELLATFNLADYIPQIASLDLQGLRKRMKAVAEVFDVFFEKVIDEHVQSRDENRTKDFVDLMLSFMGSEETYYRIDRDHIKTIILVKSSARDENRTKDFVDLMLSFMGSEETDYRIDREHIKAIILDLRFYGSNTMTDVRIKIWQVYGRMGQAQ
ncbi:hypothetical protein JRO89_XS08G0022400 [Xanthoceras sorbifolium]|uniref:Uncharacterized protein n=1 Tax=Xanthoceras sorbifolium TaxID=99658 RepID=A0ABQ8HNH7_9ROSI|nr:hypothetical protein JRO89_XS08G0022400 [Xanthoceras sorbifolium]